MRWCSCTADRAKPTEEESGRERKAEPASAAAVTVKEGREGADFDTADSPPPPPPLLICDILLQKCENVEGLLYRGHRVQRHLKLRHTG